MLNRDRERQRETERDRERQRETGDRRQRDRETEIPLLETVGMFLNVFHFFILLVCFAVCLITASSNVFQHFVF